MVVRTPVSRVTLLPPTINKRSPLDAYKLLPANQETPDPYRFKLKSLGLTAHELDNRVNVEVDELLQELRSERRLSCLFPPESIASSTPRILTKEDCMQLFSTTGVLTSGSLYGVYRWAANLGEAYCNFETDFDPQSLSLLDD